MKKFIKKSFLFIFPVFSILLIFEIILEKLPNNYSYKKNYLDKHSKNLKVLFLGNSHVYYAVNPAFIELNSFNAAYVAQTVNCDYAILKKYEDNLDSLKFVFLPIDYFSLYNSIENSSESFRTKNYFNYYRIILDGYIPKSFELFYGTIKSNIQRVWRVYHRNKLDIYSDKRCSDLGWGNRGLSRIPNKNLLISSKIAADRHKLDSHDFLNKNLELYNKTIHFLKEKKVLIILYTPPLHKYYIGQFEKKQFNNIYETGKILRNENPNVLYFDFSSDTSFVDDDFYDGDHLNDKGSKKFSIRLNELLKEYNNKE